jgi:hypothetical protein
VGSQSRHLFAQGRVKQGLQAYVDRVLVSVGTEAPVQISDPRTVAGSTRHLDPFYAPRNHVDDGAALRTKHMDVLAKLIGVVGTRGGIGIDIAFPIEHELRPPSRIVNRVSAPRHKPLAVSREAGWDGHTSAAEYEARKCGACSLKDLCRPRLGGRSAKRWRERQVHEALEEQTGSAAP